MELYKRIISLMLMIILVLSGALALVQSSAYAADTGFEAQLKAEGFPESYKVKLRELHKLHPAWKFKANHLGFTWEQALEKQYANAGTNLVSRNFPDAYKAVKSGTYDFANHDYIGKDGYTWIAASKAAVSFYMDPRNFLGEDGIFMFESLGYDPSYQRESIIKKILADTALPESASAYYMAAARQEVGGAVYEISPIYLATQTRIELGSGSFMVDGHQFEYGGKTYKNCYNTYNIGAFDSADGSAATKGLVYAAGGSDGSGTSYLRPWNTLEKAIKGGAIYIAEDFMGNNQHTMYYERFNVLNGLSNVGTHQYATSIFHAYTMASIMRSNYTDFGVLGEGFTFEIPVYQNMPANPCPKPPTSGNNNCYLDSLKVTTNQGDRVEFTPKFGRFTGKYTATAELSAKVKSLNFDYVKNSEDAAVTVSGAKNLEYGDNKITIRCKSSAGLVSKYYYLTVSKERPKIYLPKDPTNLTAENRGGNNVKLSWKGDPKATGYEISYRRNGLNNWYTFDTAKTSYTKPMSTRGIVYDFRVRAYYEEDGMRNYSKGYTTVAKQATFEEQGELTGSLYNGYMTVKLMWPEVAGVSGYTLSTRMRPDGPWTSIDLSEAETEFMQKMDRAGKGYDFYITPYLEKDGVRYYSGKTSNEKRIYTLKKPAVTLEHAYTRSVRVRWTNISGESGYEIYRSTSPDKGFAKVAEVSGKTSWLNEKLTHGKTYYYKVRAYRTTAYGTVVKGPYSKVAEIIR